MSLATEFNTSRENRLSFISAPLHKKVLVLSQKTVPHRCFFFCAYPCEPREKMSQFFQILPPSKKKILILSKKTVPHRCCCFWPTRVNPPAVASLGPVDNN